jgi:epoxyqueuosine reductase
VRLDALLIKQLALSIGFQGCGISSAKIEESHINFFQNWINSGKNAGMNYLSANTELRKNPETLLENAKSVISVILNYYPSEILPDEEFRISKYAYGQDYHLVMMDKLQRLVVELKKHYPEVNTRTFTDTAPVFERYFAMTAGLGFIGRNTCLINKDFGSWVFIGGIIIDEESDYDIDVPTNCGSCNKCIVACPGNALSENGLDANKCISYHTIENRGTLPSVMAAKISNQLFGCDICQDVCPYNSGAIASSNGDFDVLPSIRTLNPEDLKQLSNREFQRRFNKTSLLRAGRKKIVENWELLRMGKG